MPKEKGLLVKWPKLTDIALPLIDFKHCQLCGYNSDEITDFQIITECDDNDTPVDTLNLIICKQHQCRKKVDDHPRAYHFHGWSVAGPGRYMLICGNCKFMNKFICKHPNLKANGGKGLALFETPVFGGDVHIHYTNGSCGLYPNPITRCAGKELKDVT